MSLSDGSGVHDVLDADECLALLAAASVGRIGFAMRALPVVLPIKIVLDAGRLVFSTEPDLTLDAARAQHVACIGVDDYDRANPGGWSVLATGRLRELTTAAERAHADQLALDAWGRAHEPHYVELPIELLSGRRIARGLTRHD